MKKIIIISLLTFSINCASPQRKTTSEFQKAISNVKSGNLESYNNLIPIRKENSNLIWKDSSKKEVLVVSLKYSNKLPNLETLEREVWVTTTPELKNICSSWKLEGDKLQFRLNQYLGLKPDDKMNFAISFWISKDDLFRPCFDKEINDSKCDLEPPKSIDPKHKLWMDEKIRSNGEYPWTKLGYTYDWGNNSSSIGASEFIAKKGARIEVREITSIFDYCK